MRLWISPNKSSLASMAAKTKPSEVDPLKSSSLHSQSPNYTQDVATLIRRESTESMYGPLNDAKARFIFCITLLIMIFCAANNDFLGKLTYQSLPFNPLEMLWVAWLLSFGTFGVCSFGIIIGWNGGNEVQKLQNAGFTVWRAFFFAGICHVWMNGCRYVGLLFLPAPVVTILKSGSQLIFSAMFRYILEQKLLNRLQLSGIIMTCLGLLCVIIPVYINGDHQNLNAHIIGILLLLSVGFTGAVRNYYEQTFLRVGFNVNFVVGFRSFNSLCMTGFVGAVLYFAKYPMLVNMGDFPFFN